jgi:hypothetical protein
VFPLDAVARIGSGSLTIEQVIAAFGPLVSVSGRPPVSASRRTAARCE